MAKDRETKMSAVPGAQAFAQGDDLLQTVIGLTGLPREMIYNELEGILANAGKTPKSMTMDDLRAALVTYLHSMQEHLPDPESPTQH